YNGLDVDDTDGEWLAHTEAAFVSFELHGTPPEHAVFQSWSPYPRKLLPETDPDAFTYALNRYGRVRTLLSITANGSSIHGTLTAGGPVSGAPVHLTTSAGTVPASDGEFLLSGYVPGSAEAALVGFRVNMECECAGSS